MSKSTCQRCMQEFSSVARLNSHMNRKFPCKIIDIAEHMQKFAKEPEIKPEIIEEKKEIIAEEKKEIIEEPSFNIKVNRGMHLKLEKNTGNSTVIFGSSKAGKSTLLMYLYKNYYKTSIAVLFTESPQQKLFKDSNLIVAPALFRDVIVDMHKINKGTKNKYKFTALMDDIVDQKENTLVRKLILILRNSNISSIVSLQSTKLLSKANRGSVNNYIFFKFNTDEMVEEVIKLFLSSHLPGKMADKIKLYKKMTEDHQFIYYRPKDDTISIHKL